MALIGHEAQRAEFRELLAENRLSHGYLLHGPDRVGKKLFALSFAREIETGTFGDEGAPLSDLMLLTPSAGTIGIDAIRSMQEFLWQKPVLSPKRTLVVDQAEALTDEAQNALLKIAEEPPPSALIFLIVADPERLRPTVVSRFQRMFFSPLPAKDVQSWLTKEHGVPAAEAKKLAERTEGRPGLAYACLKDDVFRARLNSAERFLKGPAATRKDLLKEFSEDEEFDFTAFLDALIFAGRDDIRRNPRFWRRVLELRREAASYNLNPRLQLTALSEFLL